MKDQIRKVHKICDMFPSHLGEPFTELKANIKEHGQQDPCVFDGDVLLDGRARLRACSELGIKPKTIQFSALGVNISADQWIWATNYHRRNMTGDQRLALTVEYEYAKMEQQEAKAASKSGVPVRNHTKTARKPGRPSIGGRLRERLAKVCGQSEYRVNRMLKLAEVNPELLQEVAQGQVTLLQALRKSGLHQPKKTTAAQAAKPKGEEPAAEAATAQQRPSTEHQQSKIVLLRDSTKHLPSSDFQKICRLLLTTLVDTLTSVTGHDQQSAELLAKVREIVGTCYEDESTPNNDASTNAA